MLFYALGSSRPYHVSQWRARMVLNRGGQDTGGAGHIIKTLGVKQFATLDVRL